MLPEDYNKERAIQVLRSLEQQESDPDTREVFGWHADQIFFDEDKRMWVLLQVAHTWNGIVDIQKKLEEANVPTKVINGDDERRTETYIGIIPSSADGPGSQE